MRRVIMSFFSFFGGRRHDWGRASSNCSHRKNHCALSCSVASLPSWWVLKSPAPASEYVKYLLLGNIIVDLPIIKKRFCRLSPAPNLIQSRTSQAEGWKCSETDLYVFQGKVLCICFTKPYCKIKETCKACFMLWNFLATLVCATVATQPLETANDNNMTSFLCWFLPNHQTRKHTEHCLLESERERSFRLTSCEVGKVESLSFQAMKTNIEFLKAKVPVKCWIDYTSSGNSWSNDRICTVYSFSLLHNFYIMLLYEPVVLLGKYLIHFR